MSTVGTAAPRNIAIDRSLRGKRVDVPGVALQVALLLCLLACLAFLVLLVSTVLEDGLSTFEERGFVISAWPDEVGSAVGDTWRFLVHPDGIPGWITSLLVLVGLPLAIGTALRARRWKVVIGIAVALVVIFAIAGLIGTSSFLSSNTSNFDFRAGIAQALFGTIVLAVITALVAFPLGIATAVFLEEYAPDTRLVRFVRLNIRNLAGVPSVVYGLLGLAIFVKLLGDLTGGRTIIAGGLTLGILVLPIVVITASEAIRAVPMSLREAGYGVGATQWEVTKELVLPNAFAGILTGTILSLSRAIGETAPLILVGAVSGVFFTTGDAGLFDRFSTSYTALPMIIYQYVGEAKTVFAVNLAAAAIIVLLAVTLMANLTAVMLRNRYEKRW